MRVLAVFILLTTGLFPQWLPLNPTKSTLYSMYFTDDDHGWMSGANGTILKFNSQRFLWESQPKFTVNNLYSIGFFDNFNGLACGSNGTLLRSTDGGNTWFTPVIGLTPHLYKIQIFNETTAYLAGGSGILMKTTDKGISWEQIYPVTSNDFTSVFFIDKLFGFAGNANSEILRTTDGGQSWSATQIPHPYPNYKYKVNDIQFLDSNTGYAGGGAASQSGSFFWKTTDGGLSWNPEPSGTATVHDMYINPEGWGLIGGGESTWYKFLKLKSPDGTYSNIMTRLEGYDIFCCWITPSGQGWAAGGTGIIYHSSDFRSGWKQVYSGSVYRPISIGCREEYFIIGGEYYEYYAEQPVILRGTFDNLTAHQVRGTLNYIHSFDMKDNIDYMVDMGDGLFRSTDLGFTWQENYTSPAIGPRIFFLNDSTGWRYGGFEGIFKTTDWGISWTLQYPNFNAGSLSFADKYTGYACSQIQIIRTSDGGLTWMPYNLPFTGQISFVSFVTPETGVTAVNGILYITQDGGVSWRNINPVSSGTGYTGIKFMNNNMIIVSTNEGYVMKSSDWGYNWSSEYLGVPVLELAADGRQNLMVRVPGNVYVNRFDAPVPVEFISFTASGNADGVLLEWQTATEINNNGFEIERKTNGIWETIGFIKGKGTSTNINKYFYKDDFSNSSSEISYRLRQLDYSGSFSYSEEVTVSGEISYTLFQNYPNPFNPSTIIKFSLPQESYTNLSVFNLLGEKIMELKNETMKPGYYEVEFNVSGLSTGVYFYRLQAGNFIETRKMLYMK
jgi:photosystem II stability/assembly factor-like uncharacterized protein